MLTELILESIDLAKLQCAFVIKNFKTGESAVNNENTVVLSASLIKMLVMAEVLRKAQAGKLSLQQRITVQEADKVPFSILTLLDTGNQYSVNDLLTLMIVQSDNTAANLLIDLAGINEINRLGSDLGLRNTLLQRKMMDLDARSAGRENLTTAAEMARFMELLYRGEVIDQANSDYMISILKKQLDNTMMRFYIPDETVIAHKTGELDHLAHEAGIVYHETGDYVLVVLIRDAVTNHLARQTIGRIAKVVDDYFTRR